MFFNLPTKIDAKYCAFFENKVFENILGKVKENPLVIATSK